MQLLLATLGGESPFASCESLGAELEELLSSARGAELGELLAGVAGRAPADLAMLADGEMRRSPRFVGSGR